MTKSRGVGRGSNKRGGRVGTCPSCGTIFDLAKGQRRHEDNRLYCSGSCAKQGPIIPNRS